MSCLDDESLVQLFDGAVKDTTQKLLWKKHILECDHCFEQYFFLYQAYIKEKTVFELPEKSYKIPNAVDFIINTAAQEAEKLLVLAKNIIVVPTELLMRSQKVAFLGFQVEKQKYPKMYLFQEEQERWVIYFDENINLLTVLSDDKIHYRASYKKNDLILLPQSKKYTILQKNISPFSFKLY